MLQDHSRLNVDPTLDSNLAAIPYSNPRIGNFVTNLEGALNYLFASLFPMYIGQFANVASLPASANPNEYAFVIDESAGYVWVDLDGVAQWEKKYDVDWSMESLVADVLGQTHPLYVFLNGRDGGQTIYGGTATGENLTLNANSSDNTGEIISQNHITPATDNAIDIGKLANRVKDLFIAGSIKDGTSSLTVANLKAAFDHISVTSGNPHNVNYNELASKLGTLTIDGDGSGSVDLSSSGNKTLTIGVNNDSHSHTKSTLPDFDSDVYDKVKSILQNADGISFTANDGAETLTPAQADIDTTEITDIDEPIVDAILTSNEDGDAWIASSPYISLTGKATGEGYLTSSKPGWDLSVDSLDYDLAGATDVTLLTKPIVSFTLANPSVLNIPNHGMLSGEKLRIKGSVTTPSTDDVSYVVTVIDGNNVSIPVNMTAVAVEGYYIPQYAQLLYDPDTSQFLISKEYEGISLAELENKTADVLTQYVAKDGRVGGQTIKGGDDASSNLTLESTNHATKGTVQSADTFTPTATPVYSGGWTGKDLGSSTKKWNDLYMAGEIKGGRIENLASTPSSSSQNKGRVIYNTVEDKLYYDNGVSFRPLSSASIPTTLEVFSNQSTKAVDMSSVLDVGKTTSDYGWVMMDSTTSETVPAAITRTSSTALLVTLEVPISGSFYIKGI